MSKLSYSFFSSNLFLLGLNLTTIAYASCFSLFMHSVLIIRSNIGVSKQHNHIQRYKQPSATTTDTHYLYIYPTILKFLRLLKIHTARSFMSNIIALEPQSIGEVECKEDIKIQRGNILPTRNAALDSHCRRGVIVTHA